VLLGFKITLNFLRHGFLIFFAPVGPSCKVHHFTFETFLEPNILSKYPMKVRVPLAPLLVSRGPHFSQNGKVKAKKIAFTGRMLPPPGLREFNPNPALFLKQN